MKTGRPHLQAQPYHSAAGKTPTQPPRTICTVQYTYHISHPQPRISNDALTQLKVVRDALWNPAPVAWPTAATRWLSVQQRVWHSRGYRYGTSCNKSRRRSACCRSPCLYCIHCILLLQTQTTPSGHRGSRGVRAVDVGLSMIHLLHAGQMIDRCMAVQQSSRCRWDHAATHTADRRIIVPLARDKQLLDLDSLIVCPTSAQSKGGLYPTLPCSRAYR